MYFIEEQTGQEIDLSPGIYVNHDDEALPLPGPRVAELLPDDVVGGGPDEQGSLSALLRPSVARRDVGGRHCLVVSPHSDPSLSFVFTALT